MNFISLDLEWNQAYAQKSLAVQKRLACRLRGEVIQIGAVKLDKNGNIIGSYRTTVKPKFFKTIQRHVMKLTGISQEMLDRGAPLADAIASFKNWCGDNFAFLTWGPDDIPMLEDNLRANKLDATWLHPTYDLQRIFNAQTDKAKNQRSLEYAMEYYGIEQTLPAHDALNDAYFTALVAKKLNLDAGVAHYHDDEDASLFCATYGDADAGDKGFAGVAAVLASEQVKTPLCPLCKKSLSPKDKLLHSKGQRYARLFTCHAHGDMFMRLRLTQNFNETWRMKYQIEPSSETAEADYKKKLALAEDFPRRRYRRPFKQAPRDTQE